MLELDAITKRYADFGLGPVSLSVDAEVLAVLGPSGSGKSTLLQVIAGFVDPDAGTVSLDGRDCTPLPPEDRDVGVVFQDYALFPHLSVRENLAFGADDERRIDTYAELLDIADLLARAPPTLSGGEKQRVALARALAADPDVLLLDEPLASLDEPIRRRLRLELRDLLADLSIPVVYVTHDQEEAAVVADRVAVVEDGTLAQVGPVETVYDAPASRFVAAFVGFENHLDGEVLARRDGEVVVDVGAATVRVAGDAPADDVTVATRPRGVTVAPVDSGDRDGIPCDVAGTVRGRGETTAILRTDGGQRLLAVLGDGHSVTQGESVLARVDPERAQVLARS